MPEMQRFEGLVALITDGSSGLCRAAGIRLAPEGANVVVADIDVEGGEETKRLVQEQGEECVIVRTDVTKSTDTQNMVAETVEIFGRLDVLFPAAGIGVGGTAEQTTE